MKIEHFTLLYISLIVLLPGCGNNERNLIRYVNPFIGTVGGAHTYPGVALPFGMIQLSPDAGHANAGDYYANRHGHQYDYGISAIQGFGHLHLSG